MAMPDCLKCNVRFNGIQVIDGKQRNLYKRSYCTVCSPFGVNSSKRLVLLDDNGVRLLRNA